MISNIGDSRPGVLDVISLKNLEMRKCEKPIYIVNFCLDVKLITLKHLIISRLHASRFFGHDE
jgi:hypothetical protein